MSNNINLHDRRPEPDHEQEIYQFGYPRINDQTTNVMASTSNINSPFLATYDDTSLLQSGLYNEGYGDSESKVGQSIDPRLVMLLNFFRQLYERKSEVFKKLFPELHGEVVEMSKKIGAMLPLAKSDQIKVRTMQRSLSVGSPRTPKNGEESPLRLERFKIRTVVPGSGAASGALGGGQGDQSDTKSGGSNYK